MATAWLMTPWLRLLMASLSRYVFFWIQNPYATSMTMRIKKRGTKYRMRAVSIAI